MSEASHDDAGPIKNWKQVLALAVAAFVVPVFIIIAVVSIITGGLNADPAAPHMSEERIAARIKPVGDVNLVKGEVPAAAPTSDAAAAAATAPAAAETPAAARSGEQVYQLACAMCHGSGLAGAPKLGDSAAWKPRIAQGQAVLHDNAIHGIRAMPAKGGNPSLSDAEVSAAVDYMVSAAK